MAAIIIGHSFVRRAQKYVLQSKTSVLNLKQFSHVYFHGIGGLKIHDLEEELHMISDLDCKVCVLDLGSNDLCRDSKDVYEAANELFNVAGDIVSKYGIKVIIMQQFNRKRRSNSNAYNAKILVFNRIIRRLCQNQNHRGMIICHVLQNMWPSWEKLIVPDGTHLSKDGCRRLCRNYRTALIKACPL